MFALLSTISNLTTAFYSISSEDRLFYIFIGNRQYFEPLSLVSAGKYALKLLYGNQLLASPSGRGTFSPQRQRRGTARAFLPLGFRPLLARCRSTTNRRPRQAERQADKVKLKMMVGIADFTQAVVEFAHLHGGLDVHGIPLLQPGHPGSIQNNRLGNV